MMRKFYALVVLAGMMAGMWSGAAFAAYYDEGNDGDSWETAYIIDSVEDFKDMRLWSHRTTGKYFKLTTDLEIVHVATGNKYSWELAGSDGDFYGHFYGQNHTIKVDLQGSYYNCQLFPFVSSDCIAIKNLNVEGSIYKDDLPNGCIGGLVGRLYSGIIEDCKFNGTVTSARRQTVDGNDRGVNFYTGGIVGRISYKPRNKIEIRNCTFQGIVRTNAYVPGYKCIGGIVGEIYDRQTVIENCTILSGSKLVVSADYGGDIGGIVGSIYSPSSISYITGCTSYAELSGLHDDSVKGGIAGQCLQL